MIASPMPGTARPLHVRLLGRVPYREAWAWQRALVQARLADQIPDTLLLLEHDPVVTFGRNVGRGSLIASEAHLAERGVELVESDRGGDATFHGPGQVVGYPIFKLEGADRDIRKFVRRLEQVLIERCAAFGIVAGREAGAPGCWLPRPEDLDAARVGDASVQNNRKIGAIGCRFSRWITHHGFAFNANLDLAYFDLIVPCGIADKGVTSLAQELGAPVDLPALMRSLGEGVARVFGHDAPTWHDGLPAIPGLPEVLNLDPMAHPAASTPPASLNPGGSP
jgi:lipoyl(octanoyl) transferase